MSWKEEISTKLQKGDLKGVVEITEQQVAKGENTETILNALLAGMDIIGKKFKNNEVFVPEVLVAARAMNGGLAVLAPLLEAEGIQSIGTVILGTVAGDLHDIGKNLVKMMFIGAGFEVIDLGVNVAASKFVEAIKEHHPDIVAMSALLTTTMPAMKTTIDNIVESGLRDDVKIMIGGAPITTSYADEIGADVYTEDAATAAEVAKTLVA